MNGMIKRLMVVMLAVIMVFGMVITPAEAKGGKDRKPQPTPEPTVEPEPDAPETPVAEGEVTEESEGPAAEIPAEEVVSEDEEPAAEEIAVTETEEQVAEEVPAVDEEPAEEVVLDIQQLDANAFARTLAVNATGGTRAVDDVSINAGKTVTDTDGDGIYELALSVKATSDISSSANVTKSNVVMVIDVSGSMNYDTFTQYTYNASTYNANNRYYNSTNVATNGNNVGKANGTRLYYRNGAWRTSNTNNGTVYNGTVYQAKTRLEETKTAANAVVDALLAYNTNSDNITDIFEITVIKFANLTATNTYNGTEVIIRDSTNATDIKQSINNLTAAGGTNWEAALNLAKTEADYFKNTDPSRMTDPEEKTSVIFLTDGFPTYYVNDNGSQGGGGWENNNNISTAYTQARPSARTIVSSGYTLYNIFAFGSDTTTYNSHTGFAYIRALANYAYGSGNNDNYDATATTNKYCFNAKSTDDLVAAFNTIIDHITNSVGFAGVNITDGVSLGATSTSVAVNGSAKAESMRYTVTDSTGKISYTVKFSASGSATFTIYNADGTTTTLTDNTAEVVTTTINGTTITSNVYSVESGGKTYKISPATIDGNSGLVKWDLAGLGILESGYTYTVAFDVWPNQIGHDIAADLNNGLYPNVDAVLDAYNVADPDERQRIKDAIVHNADGSYSIYTNYEQSIEYYPATSEEDDAGNETWTYGDKQTQDLPHPDPIPLKGSLLPLHKAWESDLSESELNELLWKDGNVGGTSNEYQITLYVWKADTDTELDTLVNTGVTDDNQPYITAVLGWDAEKEEYIWDKDIAVAPGTMVNIAEAEFLGFDITDQSKIRKFKNDEGAELTYYIIESGHYYYVTESGSDLHFELDTDLYHPMIVDGTLYNVFFGEGQSVEKMIPMYEITATNTLKGGLNIIKVVSTTQITVDGNEIKGVTEPTEAGVKSVDDEFTFEIKLWKVDDEGNKSAVYTYDDQIDKENNKTISGSIGYRVFSKPSLNEETNEIDYADSLRGAILTADSEYADLAGGIFATIADNVTTIVLTMPANGEIRLVNLPAGTKYTVREIVDASGSYAYSATESAITPVKDGDEAVVSTGNIVNGSISGNKANIETYYNWAASFYVYHSSNNKVEKISFADDRVEGKYDEETSTYTYKFDIVNETVENWLYGGYYKVFSGAANTTNENIIKATYTKDDEGREWFTNSGGTAYDASKANVWKAADAYTTNVEATGGGKGTEMTPVANQVYYLKEVPNGYIRPYLHFTYDERAENMPIKKIYVFTASDDQNYTGVGYIIAPAETQTNATTASLIVNIKKYDGTTSDKLTVKSIYDNKEYHGETVKLTRGYLYWSDFTSYRGTEFTYRPCWTTFDEVLVKGVTVRTVNNGTYYVGDNKIDATDVKGE